MENGLKKFSVIQLTIRHKCNPFSTVTHSMHSLMETGHPYPNIQETCNSGIRQDRIIRLLIYFIITSKLSFQESIVKLYIFLNHDVDAERFLDALTPGMAVTLPQFRIKQVTFDCICQGYGIGCGYQ